METSETFRKALRMLQHPITNLPQICALLRGCLYILYFFFFKSNIVIKGPFMIYHKIGPCGMKVNIRGPGHVFIDRYCSVFPNMLQGLSIETLSPTAKVRIGRNCSLGGLTIRCRNAISVGDKSMTAFSLLQDSLFVNQDQVRSKNTCYDFFRKPITIGANVWIGSQVCVLPGSILGDDSVMSAGSTSVNMNVGDYCLASGSLIKKQMHIGRIIRFMARS